MPEPTRIDPRTIRGFWPPLLLPWDEQWRLDERAFNANLERLISLRPHGLYTLDTASEFYSLEFEEWLAVAERFVKRCRGHQVTFPIGLGCTWTNQAGALKRIAAARDLGVQVIHLSPPYWLPLNDDGLDWFFEAVQGVLGHLGVVIYAPPHGAIRLNAQRYERLVRIAPGIIGSKTDGQDAELIRSPQGGPVHSHFVHESRLAACVRAGALGCYSALAGISLPLVQHWWSLMESNRWEEAEALQQRVNAYYAQGVQPLRDRGILAGAIDKSMAQIGGAPGSRRLRPPYPSAPEDLYQNLLAAAKTHLPEAFTR